MITGDIKQKVDAVWQTFWNKGFTNTSAIFEQITYLLFMKMLDDKQLEKEAIANLIGDLLLNPTFPDGMWHNPTTDQDVPYNEMRWHVFKEMEPTKMLNRVRNDVFIFLRYVGKEGSAYSKAMEDTVFQITDARFLSRVIEGIDEISSDGADMMGDVYEYMLGIMAASGTNGQFRTPRHIIRMMVELMRPTLDDTICDPAMGSAGFIMEAAKYITEHQSDELLNIEEKERFRKEIFHGSDSDASMLRIGCMNMMLHDVDEPNLYYRNSLSDENDSQAMHKPIRRYALRWWTTIACKLSSRCLRGCSSLTAGFPPPSSFLRKQVQVEQTRSGFTICVPMDSRLPHNALHNPNKTIFPMSSPVSTTSKRKPTAAAKSNRSLLLPMRFVPTATTSVINVITRWSVKLSNMKLRKRLSLEWRKGRRLLMRPLQSLRNR